jgi:pilus assembly protein CpaC
MIMAYSTSITRVIGYDLAQSWTCRLLVLLMLACLTLNGVQASEHASELNGVAKTVNVPLYKSRIVQLSGPVHKISVGNKEVADILVMRANQVYILGKGIGTTNILMWDKSNNLTQSLDVEVTPDLNSLKAKLHQLLPGEPIRVNMSQGAIVLSGDVSNAVSMDTAMKVARSYLQKPSSDGASTAGDVINLMGIGGSQQVMLKVTVAEVSRSVMKRLGVKFQSFDPNGDTNFGFISGGLTATPTGLNDFSVGGQSIADTGLFVNFLGEHFRFALALDAAKENGLAKVLAEPTLTALTGQEAEFISGGEFPIPVPDDDGITIEFKEFGVGLKFVPVVLDSGRINLNLNVSVSELTGSRSVSLGTTDDSGFFVPALTKRSARSTVELGDGQTIGIAGLISENMRDVVNKFPGLGDIPVLGHLFRSQEFEKGETELVILVTPTLAQPFNAEDIALPGDGFVEPSDLEFYLLGRTHKVVARTQPQPMPAKQEGEADGSVAQSYPVEGVTDPVLQSGAGGTESKFGHSIN